jgi:hypothetical protein
MQYLASAESNELFAIVIDIELIVAAFKGVHDGIDGEGRLLVDFVEMRTEFVGGDELLNVLVDSVVLVVFEIAETAESADT